MYICVCVCVCMCVCIYIINWKTLLLSAAGPLQ